MPSRLQTVLPVSDLPRFQQAQYRFAAHIRDPQNNPPPADVEERRMAIYRDLFFNNVDGFLSSGFPVLRQLYSDAQWKALVRDFYARHQSHTPFFAEISQEFLKYLQHERILQAEDPPFLLELAHYEWVELALSVSDDEPELERIDAEGDLLQGVPALSSLAWLVNYAYPVHRIGPKFRPAIPDAQPTQIVVYRNLADTIGFMLVNPVTARLIGLMGERPLARGFELLDAIAQELAHPRPEVVRQGGLQALKDLRAVDILLGTKRGA